VFLLGVDDEMLSHNHNGLCSMWVVSKYCLFYLLHLDTGKFRAGSDEVESMAALGRVSRIVERWYDHGINGCVCL
jgi:hypothetical protein